MGDVPVEVGRISRQTEQVTATTDAKLKVATPTHIREARQRVADLRAAAEPKVASKTASSRTVMPAAPGLEDACVECGVSDDGASTDAPDEDETLAEFLPSGDDVDESIPEGHWLIHEPAHTRSAFSAGAPKCRGAKGRDVTQMRWLGLPSLAKASRRTT